MLPLFQQFIKKYGARGPMFLNNAPVSFIDDIVLPRFSVIHDLELTSERMFPIRDGYITNGSAKLKRMPVYHVDDFTIDLEGSQVIADRKLPMKIRKWTLENVRSFRRQNLLDSPVKDATINSLINYNPLKAKYNYKTSLYATYFEHANLQKEFVKTLKQAISIETTNSKQIVRIDLPTAIPSYQVFRRFQNLREERLKRVIKDPLFRILFDWYTWMDRSMRESLSLYKDITEQEAESILMMFVYKNHTTFIPLSVFLSMSDENSLKSTLKFRPQRLQKFFIRVLLKLQTQVDSIIEQQEKDSNLVDPDEEKISSQKLDEDDVDEDNPDSQQIPDEDDAKSDGDEGGDEPPVTIDTDKERERIEAIEDSYEKDSVFLSKFFEVDDDDSIGSSLVDSIFNKDIDRVMKEDEPDEVVNDQYFEQGVDKVLDRIKDRDSETRYTEELDQLLEQKTLSAAEHRTLMKAFAKRKKMTSPYDPSQQIDEFAKLTTQETQIEQEQTSLPVTNELVPESFKKTTLGTFDESYVKNLMKKDIVASVMNLENSGIIVKNYEIEESEPSSLGVFETHRITLKPLRGPESTIFFKLPKIDKNGEFYASGVKSRLRKQRTEVPIKKVSPIRVALTSSYTKLFVNRSERKQFDPFTYLSDFIKKSFMTDEDDKLVTKLVLAPVYKNDRHVPYVLGHLAQSYSHVSFKDYHLLLDLDEAKQKVPDDETQQHLDELNLYPCGYTGKKKLLVCNEQNVFFIYHSQNKQDRLGTLNELLDIPNEKMPIPFSDVKILGKSVPLGIVLAFYLGLSDLIRLLKAQPKVFPVRKRYQLQQGEWALKFKDIKLIFGELDEASKLLLGGFRFYQNFIKDYDYSDFDFENIYLPLIEFRGMQVVHLKEISLLRDIFLDPITKNVLESMNEPTEFIPLLVRANEMLTDITHPELTDARYSRIRGYDRIPSLVYRNLASSVRAYKFKSGVRAKIELDPYAIWNTITQDNTTKIVEDTNPIMNLKEQEAVTFLGIDGLSKDTISVNLRKYTKSDMGLVSELTVDSGDVGINTYLTSDPKLNSLRGTIDRENNEYADNPSKLLSTSSLLAVGSDIDD